MMDVDPETWRRLKRLVLDSVTSQHSRRAYETALDAFRDWCGRQGIAGFTKAIVQAWRAALARAGFARSASIGADSEARLSLIVATAPHADISSSTLARSMRKRDVCQ